MEKAWTLATTLTGLLASIIRGYGNRTSPTTTITQEVAVSSPPGFPMSQYDILRINSFAAGAQTMKDKLITDITWFADSAPNKEAANHMWEMLTHLMKVTVEPEGKKR